MAHGTYTKLAVTLDAYSSLMIGWAVERTLESKLDLGALKMALDKLGASEDLILHSARSVLYSFGEHILLRKVRRVQISISRKGIPSDNAKAEIF